MSIKDTAQAVIKKYGQYIKTPHDVAWYVGRAESEGLVKYKQRHDVEDEIYKKLWGQPASEEYGYDAEVEEELERVAQLEKDWGVRPLSGSHANCQHENTKAARAKCRRMSKGN